MEKKIRGTIKIDSNKTPKENITEILRQTYPTELAISKMSGDFDKGKNSLNFMGIEIYPADGYKNAIYSTCHFEKIVFVVKANHIMKHRSTKTCSIRIINGKVYICDIKWVITKFAETRKENESIKVKIEEKRAEERAQQEAEEKAMAEFREQAHFSDCDKVDINACWRSEGYFNLQINKVTKEQIIMIGKAIYNEIGKLQ